MFLHQSNKNQQLDSNFKVFGRIRPFNKQQAKISGFKLPLQYDSQSITVNLKSVDHTFVYDQILSPQASQEQTFNSVAKNVINNSFQGINSTILCYGQTCSGKTHTIVGDFKSKSLQNEGLLPRILRQILQRRTNIIQDHINSMLDIRIKMSMVQIYNQKIIDLLSGSRAHLRLRENKKKGVFIDNVTQKYVVSTQEAMDQVILGLEQRTVGKTNQNVNSSRSHMMVTLTVTQTDFQRKQARSAKLILVDLAGSQRLSRAGVQGQMAYETKKINLSLSTLGKVIAAITDPTSKHVPYRDSKLTRLLKQSIGGNALTTLIVNLSPSVLNLNETVSSLRFGARAKMIKNRPRVNKQYTVEQLLTMLQKAEEKIRQLVKYIDQLEKVISSNLQHDVRLTEKLKTQRPVLSLKVLEDFDPQQDTKSQSSTSKFSQSMNNMSETLGSQGFSLINQLQDKIRNYGSQKPKMRKSQSCLNMTISRYNTENQGDDLKISSQKQTRILHSPKNFVFMSMREEDQNEDLQLEQRSRDQKVVSMFETVKYDDEKNKQNSINRSGRDNFILEEEDADVQKYQNPTEQQSKYLEKQMVLKIRLFSLVIDIKIEPIRIGLQEKEVQSNSCKKCKQRIFSQSFFSKEIERIEQLRRIEEFNFTVIELKRVQQLNTKSEEKLAKYKAIIKKQNQYISQLKQKHKAKKMRLSNDITQMQHLWHLNH